MIHRLEVAGTRRPVVLESRAGEAFDAVVIRRDVRRLWSTGWFHDIRVEASETPAGVDVAFRVVEKPRFYLRRVRIEPRSEQHDLRIEPGTLMDRNRAQQIAAALGRRIAEGGYPEARAVPALEPAGVQQLDLVLRVDRGRRSKGSPPPAPKQDEKLCRCLVEARRAAESQGREMEARGDSKNIELEFGPAYRIGRIEFRGNHSLGDLTLRRALKIEEGGVFDRGALRKSLGRLNQFGVFEPLGEEDVEVRREPVALRADLAIRLRELPRGRWTLSGPLAYAMVAARLPRSTYFATASAIGFFHPLIPLLALERPYLPGQGWRSGFQLSPQLGYQEAVARYLLTQLRGRARGAAGLDAPREPAMMSCETRRSRWSWLRWLL